MLYVGLIVLGMQYSTVLDYQLMQLFYIYIQLQIAPRLAYISILNLD